MTTLAELRYQRDVEHLHRLGARAIAGFLDELTDRIGGRPAATTLLAEYRSRLTPAMVRAVGGDRFPQVVRLVLKAGAR